jgi:large subunit ribosomal protein L23
MDIFAVIKEPVTTEKSTMHSDKAKYAFKVNKDATKIEIKNAIKEIYGVEVEKVSIINVRPKTRLMKGKNLFMKRKWGKKAIIRIKGGKAIDVTKFKDVKKEPKKKK